MLQEIIRVTPLTSSILDWQATQISNTRPLSSRVGSQTPPPRGAVALERQNTPFFLISLQQRNCNILPALKALKMDASKPERKTGQKGKPGERFLKVWNKRHPDKCPCQGDAYLKIKAFPKRPSGFTSPYPITVVWQHLVSSPSTLEGHQTTGAHP